MRVALLGDVHGNLPALEAVLEHAHANGIEAIWNVGDFVGYGPFPEEVVQRLRSEGAVSIVGNYDLKALNYEERARGGKPKRSEKRLAFQWAFEHLSEGSRQYLAELPREVRLEVEGWRVLLTHGSPASNEEHVTWRTPPARLRELAAMADADVIVCGHSHQALVRQIEGVQFINTGSVGRPGDGDPRACYALLDLERRSIRVQHVRLEYDVDRAAEVVRERGLPEAFAQMLLQGRDLDAILRQTAEADADA